MRPNIWNCLEHKKRVQSSANKQTSTSNVCFSCTCVTCFIKSWPHPCLWTPKHFENGSFFTQTRKSHLFSVSLFYFFFTVLPNSLQCVPGLQSRDLIATSMKLLKSNKDYHRIIIFCLSYILYTLIFLRIRFGKVYVKLETRGGCKQDFRLYPEIFMCIVELNS